MPNNPRRFQNQDSSNGEAGNSSQETSNPQDKTSQVKDSQTVVNTRDNKVGPSQPTETGNRPKNLLDLAQDLAKAYNWIMDFEKKNSDPGSKEIWMRSYAVG